MPELIANAWKPLDLDGAGARTLVLTETVALREYANLEAIAANARNRYVPMGARVRGLNLRPYAAAQDASIGFTLYGVESVVVPEATGRVGLSLHTLYTGTLNTNGGLEGTGKVIPTGHYYAHAFTAATPAAADSPAAARLAAWAAPVAGSHSPGITGSDDRGEIHIPDGLGLDGVLLSWNDAASALGWMFRQLT